jgi:hypothetical protein
MTGKNKKEKTEKKTEAGGGTPVPSGVDRLIKTMPRWWWRSAAFAIVPPHGAGRRPAAGTRVVAVVVSNPPPRRETRRAASEVDPAFFFVVERGNKNSQERDRTTVFPLFYFLPSPSEQDDGKDKCSGPGPFVRSRTELPYFELLVLPLRVYDAIC